ncbi:beta-ketoacyl synthase N-terminal-like domain-containing protein [Paenibacillus sp. NPDC055715]
MRMEGHRVVITGMGTHNSIGRNLDEFRGSLIEGRTGIDYIHDADEHPSSVNLGALIRDFDFESAIRALQTSVALDESVAEQAVRYARRLPYTVRATMIPAIEAWAHAQLCNKNNISSERFSMIVSGHNLTRRFQYESYQQYQKDPDYLSPSYALHFMDTDFVGVLSEFFRIQGEGMTVGGASASGNVGIIKGYQLVQSGLTDACMVVGPLTELLPMDLQGFYNVGAMGGKKFDKQPKMVCRPFDLDHEGFIYGQAAGCLILESLDSALKREAPIRAELLGGSIVLDGNRFSNPSVEGETRAMMLALERAKVDAHEVDYLNAHGSSSPLGDTTEVKAIRNVFKEHVPNLWINSTKSLIGHCLYSAGVVEAIATIIQIHEGFVHPNLNLNHAIDNECKFVGSSYVNANIDIAASNSFGFGGFNTSIILKKVVSE